MAGNMLKYFCTLSFLFICWSFALNSERFNEIQSMSYESNSDFQGEYKRTLRAVADGFRGRIAELREDIESFISHPDVQEYLDDTKALQIAADELQVSLFNVDTNLSIIKLYRIDSEIEQLKKEWEEFKIKFLVPVSYPQPIPNTYPPTYPPPTITAPTEINPIYHINLRRDVETICSDVDRTKNEIQTFQPEQCSGYKLIPKLNECQSTCSTFKKYYIYDQVVNTPSFQEELKFVHEKCETIVNIWKLIRNFQPDKPTLDQKCHEIGALGFDIGNYPAKCEKDPFWKEQRILTGICAHIQKDYSFVDPESLQKMFKELEEKLNELKLKWNIFKGEINNPQIYQDPSSDSHRLHKTASNYSWLDRLQRTRTSQMQQGNRRSLQSRDDEFKTRNLSRLRIANL